jgi:hypothetical protein
MSKKFRDKRAASSMQYVYDTDDIIYNNEMIDTSFDDANGGEGSDSYFGTTVMDYQYPSPMEIVHTEAEGYTPVGSPIGSIKDPIDYEVGGQRGRVDNLPYSTGVVSSDLVENFELDGRQAVIRRMRNPSSVGPVGTSDHNMILALAYRQMTNQFYPNEGSQADLVRSV